MFDDEIGKVWKFQSNEKKALRVSVWGDSGDDGMRGFWSRDEVLEVFFKVKHNCTPVSRQNQKAQTCLNLAMLWSLFSMKEGID